MRTEESYPWSSRLGHLCINKVKLVSQHGVHLKLTPCVCQLHLKKPGGKKLSGLNDKHSTRKKKLGSLLEDFSEPFYALVRYESPTGVDYRMQCSPNLFNWGSLFFRKHVSELVFGP